MILSTRILLLLVLFSAHANFTDCSSASSGPHARLTLEIVSKRAESERVIRQHLEQRVDGLTGRLTALESRMQAAQSAASAPIASFAPPPAYQPNPDYRSPIQQPFNQLVNIALNAHNRAFETISTLIDSHEQRLNTLEEQRIPQHAQHIVLNDQQGHQEYIRMATLQSTVGQVNRIFANQTAQINDQEIRIGELEWRLAVTNRLIFIGILTGVAIALKSYFSKKK